MQRRQTHERQQARGRVARLPDPFPSLPADWSDGPQPAGQRGGWRCCWASLWPLALQLSLLLLFATGLAAQTMIFARADGLAESFAGLMDYLGFVGGLIAGGGLVWAGMFLRDRDEAWARSQIPGGVAAAAAGIALVTATQAISDLSASGAIPIP